MCLGEFLGVSVYICTGGTNVGEDKRRLKEGVHIVVGTPGRVSDMMKKEFLKTDHLKLVILDEADEMLGKGFEEQIKQLFTMMPGDI